MEQNLEIRSMLTSELSQVQEIEKATFKSQAWSEEGFLSALGMENNCYLVAILDGEVVGYCGCYCTLDEGEITNVATKESARGKGIATAILKEEFARIQEMGVARVVLEVRYSNAPAIHVYEKLGFENVGIRKDFYSDPKEDAIIMIKNT